MKYRSYLNLVLALAIFGGVLLLSSFERVHILSVLATPTIHQMSPESSNNGVVEAGGLQFQLFIANQKVDEDAASFTSVNTIQIPKHVNGHGDSDGYTPFYLVLRMTNITKEPIYFPRFGIPWFNLINSSGERLIDAYTNIRNAINPSDYDSALVKPDESFNFSWAASLQWPSNPIEERLYNNHLAMVFNGCPRVCPLGYVDVKPGTYSIEFTYANDTDELDFGNPPKVIRVFWKGRIEMPPIEINLVNN